MSFIHVSNHCHLRAASTPPPSLTLIAPPATIPFSFREQYDSVKCPDVNKMGMVCDDMRLLTSDY
jgi:hypothetical protein